MNRYKRVQVCYLKWRPFPPFVLSVDGILNKEDQVVLDTLSRLTATKTEEPISHVKGWVNGQIKITDARS